VEYRQKHDGSLFVACIITSLLEAKVDKDPHHAEGLVNPKVGNKKP
jgi:hypothetical protein